jgi:glycerol kinase
MSDSVLVIDQGGQSTRVAVFDQQGNLIIQRSSACATRIVQTETGVRIEQDPQEILSGIQSSIQSIADEMGDQFQSVKFAGFSGQGSSLLCWNKITGETLTPVISWQDTRAKHYLDTVVITQSQVQIKTGLRFSAHYGASKIKWCLDNIAEVQQALEVDQLAAGPIVSFILWHLTDQTCKVDPGHAQRTLLWNMQQHNWDDELLRAFSIPRSILPECLYHQDDFGCITVNGHRIDFHVSARDQGASLFAQAMPQNSVCYINIGTGAFIQRVTQNSQVPSGLLISPLWISKNQPPLFAWEATVNGAAAAIPFIEKESGLRVTPEVMDQALDLVLGEDEFFINTQGGLGAPFWRTELPSEFSKSLPALTQVATWLESILFLLKINFDKMNVDAGLSSIHMSGGFSRSEKFCQRLADLIQLPVKVGDNPEASLQGIAFLTATKPDGWQRDQEFDVYSHQSNPDLQSRFNHWSRRLLQLLNN